MSLKIRIDHHPLLELRAFVSEFALSISEVAASNELHSLLKTETPAPLATSDEVRAAVRDLLRHGGFKPTGRSKPASEYLIKSASQGRLSPINVAVDICNVVSLHSGLPISVVDMDRIREPARIAIAPPHTSYVFNPSGQSIDVGGLLCLFDADGPCANAVKDSQRTKTNASTRRTLTIIWATNQLPGRAAQAERWYRELLARAEASIQDVECELKPPSATTNGL